MDERQALLLSTIKLLSQRPIAYMPAYARLAGSVTAGVLLSQAMYWTAHNDREGGWFWKTAEEWEKETCLSYCEQASARKRLKDLKVLEEKRRGVPARMWFRVDLDRLAELLARPNSSIEESSNLECGNAQLLSNGIPQSNSYTTSDTTADIELPGMSTSLLAPCGAEDVQPIEPEPITTPAGVLSDEPKPEQTLTSKGNGSSRKPSPGYAGPTPDVGSKPTHGAMFTALAEVCHADKKIMGGRLNRSAKDILHAESPGTPEEVRAYFGPGGIYWAAHWKGRKGEPPMPEDVANWLKQAREAVRARVDAETSRAQGAGEW